MRPHAATRCRPRPTPSIAAIVLVTLTAGSAAAQGNDGRTRKLEALSLAELLAVDVVTASRHDEPWMAVPAAVHVITGEDLRRSGVTSIPDALRAVPGVHVARMNSSTWGVSARGFADTFSDKLLVLVDGRSVYSPVFSGVRWDALDFVLEDIERIEVVRGPGATAWGANAVNGVINIITRHAADTQGTLLRLGGGNEDETLATARHGWRLGDDGHARVFVKHSKRQGFHRPGGDDPEDGWHLTSAGFRADWELGSRDALTLVARAHRGRAWQEFSRWTLEAPFLVRGWAERRFDGWDVLASWVRRLGTDSALSVHFHADESVRDEPNVTDVRHSYDIELQHEVLLGRRHALTWGIGHRVYRMRGHGSFTVSFGDRHEEEGLTTARVQDVIELSPEAHLTVGTHLQVDSHTGTTVQPTIRLAWRPTPRVTAWAAASRAVRAANRVDRHVEYVLGVAPGPAGVPIVSRLFGSHRVSPESVRCYEAGMRWLPHQRLRLDLAVFHASYTGLRTAEPHGEPGHSHGQDEEYLLVPVYLDNLLAARTRGFELGASWLAHRRWRLSLAYAFHEQELRHGPGSADLFPIDQGERGNSPKHRLHLASRLDLPAALSLDVAVDAATGFPAATPDGVRLDLRLGWHPRESLELSVSVQDALRPSRLEHSGLASYTTVTPVERSVHAALTWRF